MDLFLFLLWCQGDKLGGRVGEITLPPVQGEGGWEHIPERTAFSLSLTLRSSSFPYNPGPPHLLAITGHHSHHHNPSFMSLPRLFPHLTHPHQDGIHRAAPCPLNLQLPVAAGAQGHTDCLPGNV